MKLKFLPFILFQLPFFLVDNASALVSEDSINPFGDLRLRHERDYNVTSREDRDRWRYRFRGGAVYKHSEAAQIGFRFTSGTPGDQQSPHQTLGSDFSKKEISMDQVYFKYQRGRYWGWAGKNSSPFWQQNEFLFDGDLTLEGLAAGCRLGGAELVVGQFVIETLNHPFESAISAVQGHLSHRAGPIAIDGGVGYFFFNSSAEDTASYNPLSGFDYRIVALSVQTAIESGVLPVKLGGDFFRNLENPDLAGFTDDTQGLTAQVQIGALGAPGTWMARVLWARIERFAVVANFAQDDFWRFGSGHTDGSDFKGVGIELAYQLAPGTNAMLRHYIAEGIGLDRKANRFRLDVNFKLFH